MADCRRIRTWVKNDVDEVCDFNVLATDGADMVEGLQDSRRRAQKTRAGVGCVVTTAREIR